MARRIASFVTVAVAMLGCQVRVNGADVDMSIRHIRFNAQRPDGTSQRVEKFFNTGLSASTPAARAYDAVQAGQGQKALEIMEGEVRANPGDPWHHYNLGILYEVAGRWPDAHREAEEACKMDRPRGGACNSRFREEIHFTQGFLPR